MKMEYNRLFSWSLQHLFQEILINSKVYLPETDYSLSGTKVRAQTSFNFADLELILFKTGLTLNGIMKNQYIYL